MWCLFSPIGMCFLACKHLLLADTFVTKGCFYHFFLQQTQSKRDGNVRAKAWRTLFFINPVLDVLARPPSQEVGRGGRLAASYTWTSTDSDSSLLSSRIRISSDPNDSVRTCLVSLIHNSQFGCTEQNRTAGKILVRLAPLQVYICLFLKVCRGDELCSDWLWCARDYFGYG